MFLKVKGGGGGGGSSIVPFKVGGALVDSVHVARAVSECGQSEPYSLARLSSLQSGGHDTIVLQGRGGKPIILAGTHKLLTSHSTYAVSMLVLLFLSGSAVRIVRRNECEGV